VYLALLQEKKILAKSQDEFPVWEENQNRNRVDGDSEIVAYFLMAGSNHLAEVVEVPGCSRQKVEKGGERIKSGR
jgi:hypothetical protein